MRNNSYSKASSLWRCAFNLLEFAMKHAPVEVLHSLEGSLGEVDDAVAVEGSPVVDAHVDALPVADVGNADPRVEGEGLVRRRHRVLVERLAARRRMVLEDAAVPRGLTDLRFR